MDDFQTINMIVENSIRNSSYISVLISSGVFITYNFINKAIDYFKQKDRNKPILQMATAIKDISENVVKLNQVLDKTIQDSEIKETNRIANIIQATFNSFKSAISDECIDIIIHNNIETNKDNIKQNIYKTVSTEYYKVYSIFSTYEYNSVPVANKIKEEWIDEITDECLQIIYNGQDAVTRIRQLNNKLSLSSEEFSIYINNKVFNN